jgi:hypothetical protein
MRVRQTGGYSLVLSSRDQGGGNGCCLWLQLDDVWRQRELSERMWLAGSEYQQQESRQKKKTRVVQCVQCGEQRMKRRESCADGLVQVSFSLVVVNDNDSRPGLASSWLGGGRATIWSVVQSAEKRLMSGGGPLCLGE